MRLEDRYYRIVRSDIDSNATNVDHSGDTLTGIFDVELLPDCEVYQGHFPGNPVCPGVFNIATIRECAEKLTGRAKLYIRSIRQCRLTALATPSACPRLKIEISATPAADGYTIAARISDATTTYMEYKGEMTV